MGFFIVLIVVLFLFWKYASVETDSKEAKMKELFSKKFPSRTQKIKLTRAELCAQRGVNRVPKNDVMWNVYQWESAEYLAKELWIDYQEVRYEMAELLIQEDKWEKALAFLFEAQYIEKCCPSIFSDKNYPSQPFSSREHILNLKHSGVYTYLPAAIEICNLNEEAARQYFYDMTLAQIPFPISKEEAWNIIAPIIEFYIEKYQTRYIEKYKSVERY